MLFDAVIFDADNRKCLCGFGVCHFMTHCVILSKIGGFLRCSANRGERGCGDFAEFLAKEKPPG